MPPTPSSLKNAAGLVGSLTLASRVLGFVRDMAIAWFFGAGFNTDAFFAAFRIPELLRRLFAEGTLSMSFVSVFTGLMVRKGREEAFQMAGAALKTVSVFLVLAAIAGILLSPVLVRIVAPGFSDDPEKLSLTILLTRMMFPYILFIGLVAVCMGILNALGHFASPALAPVLLNLAMIGSLWWISPLLNRPILGLAIGVVIGGVLQLALQVPFLIKKDVPLFKQAKFYHPGVKQVATLMPTMVLGAAVYQINVLAGTFLASFLPEGSVSYLYYADRVVQFPLGIFAAAASTVVLPSLTRQAMENDISAVRSTFEHALRMVLFITVPAMAGLVALREPIVALLFERGAFDARALSMTAYALLHYSLGIWAFSAIRVVVSVYYALEDTVTPVRIAVLSVAANIVLGAVLMRYMGHGGIALAASLSSMVNFFLLSKKLKNLLGGFNWQPIGRSLAKTTGGAVIMGLAVHYAAETWIPAKTASTLQSALGVAGGIVFGILTYVLYAVITRHPELKMIFNRSAGGKAES